MEHSEIANPKWKNKSSLATFKIQKRANRKGGFIQVPEHSPLSRYSHICIPEGHQSSGWAIFDQMVNRFLGSLRTSPPFSKKVKSYSIPLATSLPKTKPSGLGQPKPPPLHNSKIIKHWSNPNDSLHLFRSSARCSHTGISDFLSPWHSAVVCD